MAYTPCAEYAVAMNATGNCLVPTYSGMKMVGVAIARNDIASFVRGTTTATKNHISSITLRTGAKCIVIEAAGEVSYNGTTETFDPATNKFNKVLQFVTPQYGGKFSSQFVEPMCKNKDGYVVILQRKNNNGDCSYPIIGLERGAVCTAATMDYNDVGTGGGYTITLTENLAPSSDVSFWDGTQAATDTDFEALLANAI